MLEMLHLNTLDFSQIGLLAAVGAAYMGGLATALTPCVYPLIPITVGILGGRGVLTWKHSLLRATVFVMGLSVVYASLGFVAASTGQLFGSITQHRWLVAAIALLFLGMGFGLLGAFEVRLPTRLTQWLTKQGTGNGYRDVAIMGGVSGLLAAPCAGPITAAILGFVTLKASPAAGFALLFVYSLGLGTPFLVLGTFSGGLSKIPRGGIWTVWMKSLCGVSLIGVFYYYASQLVAPGGFKVLLLMGLVLFLISFHKIFPAETFAHRKIQFAGRVVVAMVMALFFFTQFGVKGPTIPSLTSKGFWLANIGEGLKKAASDCKPLMIDFSAEWCEACQDLDRITYTDQRVQQGLKDKFVSVKVDATEMTPDIQKLFAQYSVFALPTVLFLDASGSVQKDLTLTGFVPAEEFLKLMGDASKRPNRC